MVKSNIDYETVASFGDEWGRYEQDTLIFDEHQRMFDVHFDIFPWDGLPPSAEGFDMACGSGRWALLVAPCVGTQLEQRFAQIEIRRMIMNAKHHLMPFACGYPFRKAKNANV